MSVIDKLKKLFAKKEEKKEEGQPIRLSQGPQNPMGMNAGMRTHGGFLEKHYPEALEEKPLPKTASSDYLDQVEWLKLGFGKYAAMSIQRILDRWENLADCNPGHLPPKKPNLKRMRDMLNRLIQEGHILPENEVGLHNTILYSIKHRNFHGTGK